MIHEFMGKVFEKMAKEYLMLNAGRNGFPILTEISDYQASVIDENKEQKQICVFSLSGFTDYVKKNAGKCRLFSIEDIYRPQ